MRARIGGAILTVKVIRSMDRWKLSAVPSWEVGKSFPDAQFLQEESAPCALFGPMGYEPDYAYPVLVWLHGPGADELQLRQIMPQVSLRNYVAVAPRGTRRASGTEGFCWFDDPVDLDLAALRVQEALELAAQQYHINPQKIFLAGWQAGGTVALWLALTQPERFAGAASLGGAVPRPQGVLRRWHQARRVPLLLTCGRFSRHFPPTQVRENLRLLFCAGLDLTVREYPWGDELREEMLQDLNSWLMEQVNRPA